MIIKGEKIVFKLTREKSLVISALISVLIMISTVISVFAYSEPKQLELSTNKITVFVGEKITVKSKGKGIVKAIFTPKDCDAGILVKKNKGNHGIVKIEAVNKYFYKIEALKKGSVSILVISQKNKRLQKKIKVTVKEKREESEKNKKNNGNLKKKEIELDNFSLSQGILDWNKPNSPKGKTLSLITRNMKIYTKLRANNGKVFDSGKDQGFEFKSSDEKIFIMRGNTIIPVEKGKATLRAEFTYKGRVHSFDLTEINIGDYYPIPTSILLNQYFAVVTSNGTNNQIKIEAVMDQYGNEMNTDDADWTLECSDYETNPIAKKFGNTISIEGNEAFPTTYRMKVGVEIYGGFAETVFDIIVRP